MTRLWVESRSKIPDRYVSLCADLGVALFVVFSFLFGLGRLNLLSPDEGRHAVIALEMLQNSEYLLPTIHGLPYHDKPVLFHWLAAASIWFFGHEDFAPRLPSALSGIWMVWITARWSLRVHGRLAARVAAILLTTSLLVFAIGRITIVDMLLSSLLVSALWRMATWFLESPADRPSLYPAYAAVAVAVLVKGPVALVLAALVFIGMSLAAGRKFALLEAKPLLGGLLTAVIALPWYYTAWRASPAYIETFLLHHNIDRYTQPGGIGHEEAWWYYFVTLPLVLLPWFFVALPAVRARWEERKLQDLLPLVWIFVVFAFFQPSRAKIITYLLPLIAPLAVVTAGWLSEQWVAGKRLNPWVARSSALWVSLLGLVFSGATLWAAFMHEELRLMGLCAIPTLGILVAGLRLFRDRSVQGWLGTLVATHVALVCFVVGPFSGYYNLELSWKPIAASIVREVGQDAAVRSYGTQANVVSWYLGHPVPRVFDRDLLDSALDEGVKAMVIRTKHLHELEPWMGSGRLQEVWRNSRGREMVAVVQEGDETKQ